MANGEPTKVPVWATVLAMLWLVFLSIVCLGALVTIWPHPTPAGTTPVPDTAATDITDTSQKTPAAGAPLVTGTSTTTTTTVTTTGAGAPNPHFSPRRQKSRRTVLLS